MNILAKNLLILASAGSGKTFQLGNRIIGLVASGVPPERIVALTFTRKAAGEFTDSLLLKLAEAANEEKSAAALREDLALPNADFKKSLAQVVLALPALTLGTMDSFFSKIVHGFQYELGLSGGKFDLLEGARAATLADEMLAGILGDSLARDESDGFFHAFRRATIGREDQGVINGLRTFVERWQSRYQETDGKEWGPATLVDATPDEWNQQKSGLAAGIMKGLDGIQFTRNGQREALEEEIANLENHVIGSGSLGSKSSSLMNSILDAVAQSTGPLVLKFYKEFTINGPTAETLRGFVKLAARCEFAAALQRTRAVRDVVAVFDALCATQLRKKGMLGFNEVKLLMGEWAQNENARLRREAVDFRLDARIDHWLLDEFQDTSRADWTGLQPLIDEAASGENGSIFIVGDRKQAIYAWRGGDVGLFDEIITRYGQALEIAPMSESWRSCPEILTLVNHVSGDKTTLRELFGEAANPWDWQDHFPAEPLNHPGKRGHTRVEIVGNWNARLDRLVEILHELNIGQRAMTCGILLRSNKQAREVTDHLRMHSFDVIEEGRREPASDNPVGIAISHLLKWLADPADSFAREVVEMSPLATTLRATHGNSWREIWNCLTDSISQRGFAATLGDVVATLWADWSDFGRRRAGDLLAALSSLDARRGVSLKEAADWVARLEVSQSPGVAAVQVMTIHKAKGLGFDAVILPEIPDELVPQAQHFEVAESNEWLTQTPPKWVRSMIPEMRDAEQRWSADQSYEAFCTLYVALTRAKRGLYILAESPAKSKNPDKPSLANLLARSLSMDGQLGVVFQTGKPEWHHNIPLLSSDNQQETSLTPGAAIPCRRRSAPNHGNQGARTQSSSLAGMKFGTEVHAILENITWLDESWPALPGSEAGTVVNDLLGNPSLARIFRKGERLIELFREQPADMISGNQLLTGTIDRLHIHRNAEGNVTKVEIFDFKTDAVNTPDELTTRYSGQMETYRKMIESIHPDAEVTCSLISVRHGQLVPA